MYFPYLRGKQFELLAIRELVENNLISNKIVPIVEPVKFAITLQKTIEISKKNKKKFSVIFNPEVGDIILERDKIMSDLVDYVKNDDILMAYITNKNMATDLSTIIAKNKISYDHIILIHIKGDFAEEYLETVKTNTPLYNLIPDQRSYSRKIKDNKILFIDHFNAKKKNSDYSYDMDEFFSDDHLYYADEGYLGFSDYCTIGSKYSDGGFRPYAVAVHITYFDKDNILRIKHFVSKSNEDTADTPRKYYEALEQLIEWKKDAGLNTYALREFQKHFDDQTYPGLGTLKKLSIMHHIELVDQFLNK